MIMPAFTFRLLGKTCIKGRYPVMCESWVILIHCLEIKWSLHNPLNNDLLRFLYSWPKIKCQGLLFAKLTDCQKQDFIMSTPVVSPSRPMYNEYLIRKMFLANPYWLYCLNLILLFSERKCLTLNILQVNLTLRNYQFYVQLTNIVCVVCRNKWMMRISWVKMRKALKQPIILGYFSYMNMMHISTFHFRIHWSKGVIF